MDSNHSAIDILNRLYVLHHRSLPAYMDYAKPYALRGDDQAKEVLEQVAVDQKALAERIGEMMLDDHRSPSPGEFPMVYTGYHDVSYEFIIQKAIEQQLDMISIIEICVAQLDLAPMAKSIAEECLGSAKGHLDSLEELAKHETVD